MISEQKFNGRNGNLVSKKKKKTQPTITKRNQVLDPKKVKILFLGSLLQLELPSIDDLDLCMGAAIQFLWLCCKA